MHCVFEQSIQLDCARAVIQTVREGDFSKEKVMDAVMHGSCFLGCLASLVKGGEQPFGDGVAFDDDVTVEQLADQLEQVLPTDGDDQLAAAIPWVTVIQILIPLLLKLIQK